MTHGLRYIFAAVAVVFIAAFVAGCSGGDDGPTPTPSLIKGRAVMQIAEAPPIPSDLLPSLQKVIKARLDAAGEGATFTAGGNGSLTIDFDGRRSVNFVDDLVTTPGVVFQEPVLEGTQIKCKDTSGNEFAIAPELLQLSGNLPVCASADSRRGEIVWKPAQGPLNGIDTILVGRMVQPNAVQITKNDQGTDVLNADFNEDGKLLFQEVTKDLVGYPLGVFIGDSLLMAPLIQREIKNGRITLAGASLEGLEELQAVLKGGELPAPVTLVSIEQQ